MGRQIGRVVAEPAEVDELLDAGALGFARRRLRGLEILPLEVGAAERVDEVVRDLDAVEHASDGVPVGRIRNLPRDVVGVRTFVARDRDDIVLAGKLAEQRLADRPRRAEDGDSHRPASAIRREKYRRLTATWIRLCTRL